MFLSRFSTLRYIGHIKNNLSCQQRLFVCSRTFPSTSFDITWQLKSILRDFRFQLRQIILRAFKRSANHFILNWNKMFDLATQEFSSRKKSYNFTYVGIHYKHKNREKQKLIIQVHKYIQDLIYIGPQYEKNSWVYIHRKSVQAKKSLQYKSV